VELHSLPRKIAINSNGGHYLSFVLNLKAERLAVERAKKGVTKA
jgi:hypothetical protein